jgi:hypothetical protein
MAAHDFGWIWKERGWKPNARTADPNRPKYLLSFQLANRSQVIVTFAPRLARG